MASAALAFPRLEDVEAGPLDAPPENSAAFTVALALVLLLVGALVHTAT